MRPALLLVTTAAIGAACGGGAKRAAAPATKGSLFDEHVARGGGPYPVQALPGEVTCYGGTATTKSAVGSSDGDVETYLRRAVDLTAGTIVEDVVSLARGNPTPFRYQVTITGSDDFEASAVMGNLTEVNAHFTGRAVTDGGHLYQAYQLKDKGAFVFTLETVTDDELESIAMVFVQPDADDLMALSMLATEVEKWTLFSSEAEADQLFDYVKPIMMSESHLAVIAAPRCAEMFAAFGPAVELY